MAKTTSKTAAKTAAKSSTTKAKAAPTQTLSIEKVSDEVLSLLQSLNIEPQLQADLEWCIGSYRADQNPSGLYEMIDRARTVLNAEKEKKTKGVTVKLITDIEKALKTRQSAKSYPQLDQVGDIVWLTLILFSAYTEL